MAGAARVAPMHVADPAEFPAALTAARATSLAALACLALFLLSGCVALPDAAHPEESGVTWIDTSAPAWVTRHGHCGFGGGPGHACESLTILYRDGAVLDFTFGRGRFGEDPAGLRFANATHDAQHRDEVLAAWNATFGDVGDLLVHDLHARRMDPNEREDVLRVIENVLRQSEPLPEPTFDCQDCGSVTYWATGRPRILDGEEWGHPAPDDDAWALLEEQMGILRTWVAR